MNCQYCGSLEIYKFRLDDDLDYGSGDYTMVNNENCYSTRVKNLDVYYRLDIVVYQCLCCRKNIKVDE